MKIKDIGFWTNPFVWVAAVPLMVGIVASAMLDGVFKKTSKIVKGVNKDIS